MSVNPEVILKRSGTQRTIWVSEGFLKTKTNASAKYLSKVRMEFYYSVPRASAAVRCSPPQARTGGLR